MLHRRKEVKTFIFLITLLGSAISILLMVLALTLLSSRKSISLLSGSRLVCYYAVPDVNNSKGVRLSQVDANLCTHINVGAIGLRNCTLVLTDHTKYVLENEIPLLRSQNSAIKILAWIGGGDVGGFSEVVIKHNTRKIFIRSLKEVLHRYKLDGIDLDWEFPSAYNKERMHFSQLLYEIRQEFKREKRDYLLSIAVASVEGIAEFSYDIRQINLYADYVNLMAYDYHFYSPSTPFTGLNAPLFARDSEHSILATLNINYSINWWLSNGIDRTKLVVGLPTYGHSFTLVNPFNNKINAPAANIGSCGDRGFATYSDVCWFISHNVGVQKFYDHQTESPYLSSGTEWISYENETSIAAKAKYISSLNLGGMMAFTLNTDDIFSYCASPEDNDFHSIEISFPLIRTIKKYFLIKT